MLGKRCDGTNCCLWSDAGNFCQVLKRAGVPLDEKWPVTILQLRAIDQDVTISADQKVDLQEVLFDLLKKKDFSEAHYREVRRNMAKIYAGPFEKQLREITLEVNEITEEVGRVLGRHKAEVLSVATTMDNEISQGRDPTAVLGTLRSTLKEVITKMERDTVLFRDLSTKDGLTGLANRRSFDAYLEASVELFLSGNVPVSLLIFDIDKFKTFNDQYGHLVGDQVLKRIASLAEKAVETFSGENDEWMVARFGGDEFVMILRGPVTQKGDMLADRLCRGVAKSALLLRDAHGNIVESGLKVTISVGLARLHKGWRDNYAANLISYADKALYEAKKNGRNCVGVYDPMHNTVDILKDEGDGQSGKGAA